MKESSSRSFPSDKEKNPKDCMAITLWSGKELEDGKGHGNCKNVENGKTENEKIVDKEGANKRVEDEKVEADEQEVQMDKEEEREKKNSLHQEMFYFLTNPPQSIYVSTKISKIQVGWAICYIF